MPVSALSRARLSFVHPCHLFPSPSIGLAIPLCGRRTDLRIRGPDGSSSVADISSTVAAISERLVHRCGSPPFADCRGIHRPRDTFRLPEEHSRPPLPGQRRPEHVSTAGDVALINCDGELWICEQATVTGASGALRPGADVPREECPVPFGSPAIPPSRNPWLCALRINRRRSPFRGTPSPGPAARRGVQQGESTIPNCRMRRERCNSRGKSALGDPP